MREIEIPARYIVGLTSMHSSGTSLPERDWMTLIYAGVVQGERQRARVGLSIAPLLSANVLEFTPVDKRVATMRLWLGEQVLTDLCLCVE